MQPESRQLLLLDLPLKLDLKFFMYFLKENHGLEICKIKKCLKETELQITFKDSKSVEEFIDNKFFELKEQKVTVLEVRKQDPETEIKIKKRVSETQVQTWAKEEDKIELRKEKSEILGKKEETQIKQNVQEQRELEQEQMQTRKIQYKKQKYISIEKDKPQTKVVTIIHPPLHTTRDEIIHDLFTFLLKYYGNVEIKEFENAQMNIDMEEREHGLTVYLQLRKQIAQFLIDPKNTFEVFRIKNKKCWAKQFYTEYDLFINKVPFQIYKNDGKQLIKYLKNYDKNVQLKFQQGSRIYTDDDRDKIHCYIKCSSKDHAKAIFNAKKRPFVGGELLKIKKVYQKGQHNLKDGKLFVRIYPGIQEQNLQKFQHQFQKVISEFGQLRERLYVEDIGNPLYCKSKATVTFMNRQDAKKFINIVYEKGQMKHEKVLLKGKKQSHCRRVFVVKLSDKMKNWINVTKFCKSDKYGNDCQSFVLKNIWKGHTQQWLNERLKNAGQIATTTLGFQDDGLTKLIVNCWDKKTAESVIKNIKKNFNFYKKMFAFGKRKIEPLTKNK